MAANQLTHLMQFCAAAASIGLAARAAASPPVTVAWRDKPPYHYTENGEAKGFLLQRTQEVFARAGIEARFVNEPQKRIWANFAHGATNYCSISWYDLPERQRMAQFSTAIHIDAPHTVLVSPVAVAQVKAHPTLASLLADPSLTLALVDGVSYGPELDAMIARSANQVMRRTVEATNIMRMLAVGRASFMFADRADWDFYRQHEPSLHVVVQHEFPDLPPGQKRHIACSKDISADVMGRLNAAITASGGPSSSK